MHAFFKGWPKLLAVGVILVAIIAVTRARRNSSKPPEGQIWFYNLKTQELFAGSDRSVPPIDTQSGAATAVQACVYTCDVNPKSTNRFIAYLKKFSPELKQAIDAALQRADDQSSIGFMLERNPEGVLVSSLEAAQWFPELSDQGQKIVAAGIKSGGCPHPQICLP